jgi:predicted deacylase
MMASLPCGVELEVFEFTGAADGPTLSVLGGVHGDELEGVTAARLFAQRVPELLTRGRVRVVPVANPLAYAANSRCSPIDGGNLARLFPGAADGTATEQIADALTRNVISGSDLLVDLHSAGVNYEMPVFAGCTTDAATGPAATIAAVAFGAPILWPHSGRNPGRSLTAADDLGVPGIYVEGSGGGGLRGADLDIYTSGLANLLCWLGMSAAPRQGHPQPIVLHGGDGDVDASLAANCAGLCVTRVRIGQSVAAGDLLAVIYDERGRELESVVSPRSGTVMMLRRRADVAPGDGIAMLGPLPS